MSRRNSARRRRTYAPRQRELRRRQPELGGGLTAQAEYTDYETGWQAHYGGPGSLADDGRQAADG